MNNSDVPTSNNAYSDYSIAIANAYVFIELYVVMPFLFFALYGNLISAFIFSVNGCKVQSNARFFYILLSCCDFLTLSTYQLPVYLAKQFVSFRDAYWSPYSSLSVCVTLRYIFTTTGAMSAWSMVAFVTERAFAITHPLKAVSGQYSSYSIYATLGFLAFFLTFDVFNFFGYVFVTTAVAPFRLCKRSSSTGGMIADVFFIVRDFLPSVLQLVCNSFVLFKITKAARARTELTKQDCNSKNSKPKDLKNTLALIVIPLLRCIVYFPMSVTWLAVAGYEFSGQASTGTYKNVYNIGMILLYSESLPLGASFVVYMLSLRNYRVTYGRYFCFTWLRRLA